MGLDFTNNEKKESNNSESDKSLLDNHIKIITDEPSKEATDFESYADQLSNIIINSKPRFTVGIYGGWGTGKTTLMQMIRKELDKNYSKKVVTIWFDSWRYEREEYSALVPLLRTIILGIDNGIKRLSKSGIKDQNKIWRKYKDKWNGLSAKSSSIAISNPSVGSRRSL